MRDLDLAYLAGMVDGDGYITVHRGTHSGRPYLSAAIGISGNRRQPHDLASSLFGGRVRLYGKSYHWSRQGRAAAIAISALLPYLRVKAAQALAAIETHEAVAVAPYLWPADLSDGLDEIVEYVRTLNVRRGRAPRVAA